MQAYYKDCVNGSPIAMTESVQPPPPPRRDGVALVALTLAILGLLAAMAVFWFSQMRMQDLQLQLAQRIGEFDNSSREARSAATELRTTVDGLLARFSGLEARALEAQSQQLALAAMYQELARSQDERLLADIEQTLLLADQQLHMASNVRAAILGLEAVDARLARLDKPQFARLREAVNKDAARLKLLPAADVVAVHARLDVLVQNVARLRLESDADPLPRAAPKKSDGGGLDWLERIGLGTWNELRQLVRIRRLEHPELPLLTPNQAYFLRQNLVLRLLAARLALLQRDETTFRRDLAEARRWIGEYFKRDDPLTQSMLHDLQALEAMPVELKDAEIKESLGVLRRMQGAGG